MTRQGNLYDSFGTVHAEQPDLFAGQPVTVGLSCSECGAELVRTESGYGVCPNGHGRLVAECEPLGAWFEECES